MKHVLPVLLILPLLAGCIQSDDPAANPSGSSVDSPSTELRFEEDGAHLDIPVDVVMVGFPQTTVESVATTLEEGETLEHIALDYARALPESPTKKVMGDANIRWPWTLHADYVVKAAPMEVEDAFFADLAGHTIEGEDAVYDGNHAAANMAQLLSDNGFVLDSNRPTLVVVHAGDRLADNHAYRFTAGQGYLQPVRLIEDTAEIVLFDVSAIPDPYAGTSRSYGASIGADNAEAVDALVRDITHFRLLHGPIYPVATTECHAVTLILGVRAASLSEALPGFTKAEDAVNVERIAENFRHLTGDDNVFVDYKLLMLPQDDPVLDAITRESNDLDAFRYWLEENWENYWVAHEGCEPYVSFALYGDFSDEGVQFSGIAIYDVGEGHRISFSLVSDSTRISQEWDGLSGVEQVDDVIDTSQVGRGDGEWFNRLFSHETGHLFGQAHPHNAIEVDGDNYNGFSSVLDTMSYQVRGVTDDFGPVASNNFLRNRAGWLLGEAYEQGLQGSPEAEQAITHIERFEWKAAGDVLAPVVN